MAGRLTTGLIQARRRTGIAITMVTTAVLTATVAGGATLASGATVTPHAAARAKPATSGAVTGVSGTSTTRVTLTPPQTTPVVQAAPVKVAGVYYVSAEATFTVVPNGGVGCELGDGKGGVTHIFASVGSSGTNWSSATLPLNGVLRLKAGQAPTMLCSDNTGGSGDSSSVNATITAILVTNPNPAMPPRP